MTRFLASLVALCLPLSALAQSNVIQGVDVSGVKRTIRTDSTGRITPSEAAQLAAGFNSVAVTNAAGGSVVGTLTGRRTIFIQNLGLNALYCGASLAGVTVPTIANAVKLPAGSERSYDIATGLVLKCIAETAAQLSPADTRYQEVG
jgi:hypothetical protein